LATFLVTGGAGFIGSHLVEALLQRGEQVRVLDHQIDRDRLVPPVTGGALELVAGDIRDEAAVRRATHGVDFVLHQAAIPSVTASVADPISTDATNVRGTLNVLLAARDAGVRRVVFASTCAIYGDRPELPLVETLPPSPLSPYAVSKLAAEQYCAVFSRLYGLATVSLRYFNVFGPRQSADSDYAAVVPRFVARALRSEPPTIFGDGRQTRDFIYVADVVRAVLLACKADCPSGAVINVGSGQQSTLLDLVAALGDVVGRPITPQFAEPRPGDIRDSCADIGRAAQWLGFRPDISLREGLRRTLEYARAAQP